MFVEIGIRHENPTEDSDHCNTPVTRFTEKRWTIWKSNIRNNSAKAGGGIMNGISELNYFALVDLM